MAIHGCSELLSLHTRYKSIIRSSYIAALILRHWCQALACGGGKMGLCTQG